jgi:hypothetical protein
VRIPVLVLLVALVGCDKTEPAPVAFDPDKQSLATAKELAVKGDLEGAHRKIAQIPLDSAVRQSGEIGEIETQWGRARIANTDAGIDSLREVANASNVSPDVRNQASNKLALIESEPKMPDLLSHYDSNLAEANLEKCRALLGQKKMKEPRDLLYPRVTGGIGSPEERDMLVAICTLSKDKDCLLELEKLQLVDKRTVEDALKPDKKSAAARDR